MALCSASLLELPQLPSSVPAPPRLMLATLIPRLAALLVTQSMPQMTEDHVPEPALFSTRTEYSGAPGATPTTPTPLSLAATVPATCVPWPLPSLNGPELPQLIGNIPSWQKKSQSANCEKPSALIRRSG